MSNVVAIKTATEGKVSKKVIAQILGYSTRWVELRMRDGMPYTKVSPTAHPRFVPSECQQWVAEWKATERPAKKVDPVAELKAQIDSLTSRINQLERKAA